MKFLFKPRYDATDLFIIFLWLHVTTETKFWVFVGMICSIFVKDLIIYALHLKDSAEGQDYS